MSSRNIGASLLSRRAWRAVARSMQKRSRMLIVSLLVLTSCMTILGINPFSQHAKAQASPRVTVAAIDPSLVAGRGAKLGIVQQEAENATTNGTILVGLHALGRGVRPASRAAHAWPVRRVHAHAAGERGDYPLRDPRRPDRRRNRRPVDGERGPQRP